MRAKLSQELLALVQANPDLPIEFFVAYEVCASDEWHWWKGELSKVSLEEVYGHERGKCEYGDDERVYIRSQDEEDLIEHIAEYSLDEIENDDERYKKSVSRI